MPVARMHRYAVDPTDLEELLTRRATLIAAMRAAHPGLAETQLIQFEDGTYADIWTWDSAEQMTAAQAALPDFPEAGATMSLTQYVGGDNGEVVDQR